MPEGELIAISKIPEISAAIGRCLSFTFLLPHHPLKIYQLSNRFPSISNNPAQNSNVFSQKHPSRFKQQRREAAPSFAKLRFATKYDKERVITTNFGQQRARAARRRIRKAANGHFVFLVM